MEHHEPSRSSSDQSPRRHRPGTPKTGEFRLIEWIRDHQGDTPSFVQVGIGDDSAILDSSHWPRLVVTTDTLVEDVDFRHRWMPPGFLGRKALAVSLSDLAANGARPAAFLLNLVLPPHLTDDYFRRLVAGAIGAGKRWQVPLVGGDLSRGDSVHITVTALGYIIKGEPLLRGLARPGDAILLIGETGWSHLGLHLLETEQPDLSGLSGPEDLREWSKEEGRYRRLAAHLLPEPLLEAGAWLQEKGLVHAAIDVSDGLAADLLHVTDASGVGARLDLDALIPATAPIRETGVEWDVIQHGVLNGGEDYSLLLTASTEQLSRLNDEYPAFFPPFSYIGEIVEGEGLLLRSGGLAQPYVPRGFDHFR